MEHAGAKPVPLHENVSAQFIMSNTAHISQQLKKRRKKRMRYCHPYLWAPKTVWMIDSLHDNSVV